MQWLLVLCLLVSCAFSRKFVNGTVGSVEVEDGEVIMRGDKTLPILTHPNNENKKIVLIAVPYAQKNDIELLSVKNGVSKKVLYKVIKGDYKEEVLTVAPSKATPPKEALERIKKESDEASVIYKSRPTMRYW